MKQSKIALKPYLDTISGYCDSLSNEELTEIIIRLAKDVPNPGRVSFLEKFQSCLSNAKAEMSFDAGPVEQILDNIEALKENMEERIESIEDGSYWNDPDGWGDDEYYNDEPDYISEDQVEELDSFFDDAESLFLNDRLEDARKVYEALFSLINDIKEIAYISLGQETDIREARARYCRCVYETSDARTKLDEFVTAMEIDVSVPYDENEYNEDYPMLQDVMDARPGEIADMESFLPAWKKVLAKIGTKTRPAVLLLEAVDHLEGISGVSRLAKKWKGKQPQGYIYWLNILKTGNDPQSVIKVSTEALKVLKEGRFRERVAQYLIDAAEKLNDDERLMFGKREKFFSHMSDQNLLDFVDEANKLNAKGEELEKVIQFFKARKSMDDNEKVLYLKTFLMSGELNEAVGMAKHAKSVGWSYRSNAGVVFGSVLSALTGYSEKAGTIKILLKGYANQVSVYSGNFLIDDGTRTSFYDEIIKGLKQKKEVKSQAKGSLPWAEKIGKSRIDHIVSNKHRGAYERAAQVLGSLAETYVAMGRKGEAVKLLHTYYREKYKRFRAFRREVKAVVIGSDLLRNCGFLP